MENFAKSQTQFSGTDEEADAKIDEMTKAMLEYMPIRTLRSFGDLDNETIDAILTHLRTLI